MKKFIIFLIILLTVGFGIAVPTTIIVVKNQNKPVEPTQTTPTVPTTPTTPTTTPKGSASTTEPTTSTVVPTVPTTVPTVPTTSGNITKEPDEDEVFYHFSLVDTDGNELGYETVSYIELQEYNSYKEKIESSEPEVKDEETHNFHRFLWEKTGYGTKFLKSGKIANYYYSNAEIEEVLKDKEYNVIFTLCKELNCNVVVKTKDEVLEEKAITIAPKKIWQYGEYYYENEYAVKVEAYGNSSLKLIPLGDQQDYCYSFSIPDETKYNFLYIENSDGEIVTNVDEYLKINEDNSTIYMFVGKEGEPAKTIVNLTDYKELMDFRKPSSYKAVKVNKEDGSTQIFTSTPEIVNENNEIGFLLPLTENSSLIKTIKLSKDSPEELNYTKLPKAVYIFGNPDSNEEFYFEFEEETKDTVRIAKATINLKDYFTEVQELSIETDVKGLNIENPVVDKEEECLMFKADSLFKLNGANDYKLELLDTENAVSSIYFKDDKYYYVLDSETLTQPTSSLIEKNNGVLEVKPSCKVKISTFDTTLGTYVELGNVDVELNYNLEKEYKVNYIPDYSFEFNDTISSDSNKVRIFNVANLNDEEFDSLKSKIGEGIETYKNKHYYFFTIKANSEFDKDIIQDVRFVVNDNIEPMQSYVVLDKEIYVFFLGNDMPYETSSSMSLNPKYEETLFTSSIKFTTVINGYSKTTTYKAFKNTALNIDAPIKDVFDARVSPDAKFIYINFMENYEYVDKYVVSGIDLSLTLNDETIVPLTNFNTKVILTSSLMNKEKYDKLSILEQADYAEWYSSEQLINNADNYPEIDPYEGYYKYRIELSYQAQQALKNAINNNSMKYRNEGSLLLLMGLNTNILNIRLKELSSNLELSSQAGFGMPNETACVIYVVTLDFNKE